MEADRGQGSAHRCLYPTRARAMVGDELLPSVRGQPEPRPFCRACPSGRNRNFPAWHAFHLISGRGVEQSETAIHAGLAAWRNRGTGTIALTRLEKMAALIPHRRCRRRWDAD